MSNTIKLRALRPLASRDYRLLFAAVGIEVFGTGMWTIVMVFQVLALDDSPLALSAVATGMSLGLFAFSVLGGVVADRFSKRRILITVQGSTASELCVSGRGRAAPWWAVGHFVEGLFCPPAGGASALLDRRYPLEYLSPLAAMPEAAVQAYQPFWATRAALLRAAGQGADADEALARAIGLTSDPALKAFLAGQRQARLN